MPRWLAQSGERNETVYYSQGMGLWLNYTEHVGDPRFDPGNSLWVPSQESGVDTYSIQCSMQRSFCTRAVGELREQYCQVMDVYCGTAMTLLQLMLPVIAGIALVVVVWAIHLITTTHCTVADLYLTHLCMLNGVGCLVAAMVWYFFVFRLIINSTFYQDQSSRCSENNSSRTCWQIGPCVYFLIAGGFFYPMLAMLVISHATNKFKRFQQLLRQTYETIAVIEASAPVMDMKTHVQANGTLHSTEVALDVNEIGTVEKTPVCCTLRGAAKNDIEYEEKKEISPT
ncbi:unnamed protein product [Peronospora destructor]|uniref:G-protein coupled receptors family 2 profile 2 domain-containing protein n=1 Tax=Peronospora destructor TaxID=86335 RepID=A0AAV0U1R2_9STRA|nr:unnamed protein product [Peronospora destructor]